MPQNLLIIGATGVIGKYITSEIIKAKASFGRVVVLTSENTIHQKSSQIDELKRSGIEILVADITKEEEVKRAYQGPPLRLFSNPGAHIWQVLILLCLVWDGA
jgi:FlaA1/EpsC-like NDP-sugar epimerase